MTQVEKGKSHQGQKNKEKHEKERVKEQDVFDFLKSITPRFFKRLLGGIQDKQRNDMAERYGFSCGRDQRSIDFTVVAQQMRNLIAENGKLLSSNENLVQLKLEREKEELGRVRDQRTKIQAETAKLNDEFVRVEDLRDRLDRMAMIIGKLGDRFARKRELKGVDAQAMLNQSLDAFERELKELG